MAQEQKYLISETFLCPGHKIVSATNVARAGKRGNICIGNNVYSFASAYRMHSSIPQGIVVMREWEDLGCAVIWRKELWLCANG